MLKRYRLMFSTLSGTRTRYFPSTFRPFHESPSLSITTHLPPQRTPLFNLGGPLGGGLGRGGGAGGGEGGVVVRRGGGGALPMIGYRATPPERGPFFDSGIQGCQG